LFFGFHFHEFTSIRMLLQYNLHFFNSNSLVSGKSLQINAVITTTKKAEKINNTNFIWQSIVVKIWAMANVQIMLTETLIFGAEKRTSSEKISLGNIQLIWPKDMQILIITQIHMTTTIAYPFGNTLTIYGHHLL